MNDPYGKVIPFRKRGEKTKPETEQPEPTFKDFAGAILAEDEKTAGEALASLFSVERDLADRCAKHFAALYLKDGDPLLIKTMLIKKYLEEGETNKLILLLIECFGVSSPEAVFVIAGLSKRFLSQKA